jgi:acyl carrier protein
MTANEIRRGLFEILHRVAPETDLDRIAPDENIREALEIDSFDFLNVMIAVHDKFGIDIPESDYPKVATLRGMMEYLARM